MKVSNLYKEINNIVYCTEDQSLEESLEIIEKSGYRCVPVLDKTGKTFLGNIYKTKIYEYIVKQNGDLSQPVTLLAKEKNETIRESDSFYKAFLSIKRLPYLTILDDKDHFVGILTHSRVMELLEESWGVGQGSYTLSIICPEYRGALNKVTHIINKYTHIQSVITLDNQKTVSRRIVVTLPKEVSKEMCDEIIKSLYNKGFKVFDVESNEEINPNLNPSM